MAKAYSYIRMSTDAQLQGDSLRRQVERTAKFAEENDLVLDQSLDLHDIGRSAYDGSNVEKGRLGEFLQAVRDGKVEKGSYLVVESLDRLSRQRPRHALRLFLDLLDHGINVATLVDRRTYTPDSGDQMDLMLSIALMVRAHDESLHKSDRLTAVWSNKRKNARSKPMTNRCKAWLRPRADRSGFDAIPERTDVIKRIFCESADFGIGADAIARRFNKEGLTTFGSSNGWYKSYILKILMDRAVLGEFQPHRVTTNGREPVGEPLVDYYPKIIDEDLFYRAQTGLGRRRIAGGGRKGARVSNLFSKVAKCGICGSRMTFVNKGGPNGKALICDAARRGLGCHPIPWRYEEFERSFLTFIKELDLASLTGSAETKTDLDQTRDRVRELPTKMRRSRRDYDIVIIDECEQVLAHAVSKTVKKQVDAINALQRYVTKASSLYLFDADINHITHNFVSRCRSDRVDDPTRVYLNTYVEPGRTFDVFPTSNDLVADLIATTGSGKRSFVVCNSKRFAKIVHRTLTKEFNENCRLLLITAEGKAERDVQDFLHDVKQKILDYDVVIASPAIGTGIDITFQDNQQLKLRSALRVCLKPYRKPGTGSRPR